VVNFYENAVTAKCRQALGFLEQLPFLLDYYLAGGTALALQIGHRISTDLDWFSTTQRLISEERERLRIELNKSEDLEITSEQDGLFFTRLFGTDVSFIYQHHPLLEPTVEYSGIHLASPIDIGLMKLAAINSRGTRRDFVDLYSLREAAPLNRLLDLAPLKYTDRPNFLAITARALSYFDDADQQPMPRMLAPVLWKDVRAYCEAAARELGRRFSDLQ